GAMANTFLLAKGIETGRSLAEPDDVPVAKRLLEKAEKKAAKQPFVLYLPQDGVVATDLEDPKSVRIVDWDAHIVADIENYPRQPRQEDVRVKSNEMILDIGPFSGSFIAGGTQLART